MYLKHLPVCIALAAVCVMTGCRSKIDLDNLDPTAEVQMGLALPVGTIQLGIKEFIGKIDNLYVDSLDGQGVITWKSSFEVARDYHDLKLESYVPGVNISLPVREKIQDTQVFDNGKISTKGFPDDFPMAVDFPIALKLNGLNHPDSVNKARLDSALIEMASFASTIQLKNGLPMEWDWIDSVYLDLGDRINRPAGNRLLVYEKNNPKFASCDDFGKKLETNVDNFSLVLMKKTNIKNYLDYANDNVVDSCNFNIRFCFTIPKDTTLTIPDKAGFDYRLDVQFLTYKAVWGMFKPSNQMSAEEVQDLTSSWGDADFITTSSLPFSDPVVDVDITTHIAGAMRIDSAYIYSLNQADEINYAQFGDYKREVVTRDLENWLPIKSAIGDSATMHVRFDNTSEGGRLARLFKGIPKKIGYCFNVKFVQNKTPQIRITPNTSVHVKATATLPMKFDKGLHISYTDTLTGINVSQFSIDSLLAGMPMVSEMKTTDVDLVIQAFNDIPFDVKASMRCFDKNDRMIMDPADSTKPLLLIPEDTLRLVAPKYEKVNEQWIKKEPGQTTITVSMTKEKLDRFPDIKYIMSTVVIDDESLQSAFDQGNFNIKLTDDARVSLKISLTAQLDALLNLSNNKDNQ